jgi:hypothetical protein
VVELGEQPGLIDEAAQADLEGVLVALRADDHRGVAAAGGQRRGHVFLDRDPALQRVVVGEIDDAEAALADQVDNLEFGQAGARRQGHIGAAAPLGRGRRAGRRSGTPEHDGLVVVGVGHLSGSRAGPQSVGE